MERKVVFFARFHWYQKETRMNSTVSGEFSCDNTANDVFVLQNGFYRFNGKWKQRRLGKLETREIEHLEIFEKDGQLYYNFNVLRSNRLRSSIIQNRIKDIGKIKPETRGFNLNADRKRFLLSELKSLNEKVMCDSFPISMDLIDYINN